MFMPYVNIHYHRLVCRTSLEENQHIGLVLKILAAYVAVESIGLNGHGNNLPLRLNIGHFHRLTLTNLVLILFDYPLNYLDHLYTLKFSCVRAETVSC